MNRERLTRLAATAVALAWLAIAGAGQVLAASPSPTPGLPPGVHRPSPAASTSLRIVLGALIIGAAFLMTWRRRPRPPAGPGRFGR